MIYLRLAVRRKRQAKGVYYTIIRQQPGPDFFFTMYPLISLGVELRYGTGRFLDNSEDDETHAF